MESHFNKNIYWCIKPSIERENYADYSAAYPWKGVLTGANRLSRINDDGVVDTDMNATAFVERKDLFFTKQLAKEVFIKQRHFEIENLLQLISKKIKGYPILHLTIIIFCSHF